MRTRAKTRRQRREEQKDQQALEFYIQAAREAEMILFSVRGALLDGKKDGDEAVTYVDAVELAARVQCAEALLAGAVSYHEYGE